MEEILSLTANYAFPIVVSLYLLIRMENKFTQLSDAIIKLSEIITKCSK